MVRTRRRYSRARHSRPLKTVKYSSETTSGAIVITPDQQQQQQIALVGSITSQGMRKAKNFTLRMSTVSDGLYIWVLVYIPQGTSPQVINTSQSGGSLYEPNQNVIMSGYIYKQCPQETFRTRLARNLNSGDSIALCIAPLSNVIVPESGALIYISLNYAITY